MINRNTNFRIAPYGGFGNNLQQIALSIMYAQKYGVSIKIENVPHVNKISLKFNPKHTFDFSKPTTHRFFYFGDGVSDQALVDPPLNVNDFEYYKNNFQSVFKKYIRPKIIGLEKMSLPKNLLVVHVRDWEGHPDYAQNPYSYYKYLNNKFDDILFVTDNPYSPIFNILNKNMSYEIQSTSLIKDLNTLISAKNLASSGVGTFITSAALLSKELETFYFSNFYLSRHLNPEMLEGSVSKIKINLKKFPPFNSWKQDISKINQYLSSETEFTIENLIN
jgi:hypothetical protein